MKEDKMFKSKRQMQQLILQNTSTFKQYGNILCMVIVNIHILIKKKKYCSYCSNGEL